MGNYAVRIYDPTLKQWLIAEAARRGRGIRTSDVVEAAIRSYQTHGVHEGSAAPVEQISPSSAGAVRGGDAPDRPAAPADLVSREAVVQPLPPVDPTRGVDDPFAELNAVTRREVARGDAEDADRPIDPSQRVAPVCVYAPVPREQGPDRGPDDDLGF